MGLTRKIKVEDPEGMAIDSIALKRKINLQIRNKLVKVEGTSYGDVTYTLYSPPKIKDSRTFVPVRFLSEQMGYTVTWDGETQSVIIEK